jgi:hypothetical protein
MATNNVGNSSQQQTSARKMFKSLISSGSKSSSSASGAASNKSSALLSDALDLRGITTMDGLLKYEDLTNLLTCGLCKKFCGTTIIQCRKGHVVCRACKSGSKLTSCKVCKQTFVDAPNVVLDKLIAMIALPCKFRSTGCKDFLFADGKLDHETFCKFRPINCQYTDNGCDLELPFKDISGHHKTCQWNPRNKQQ